VRETKKVTYESEEVVSLTCDVCGVKHNRSNGIYEFQEFSSIRLHCGYGSVFGDGDTLECDICQKCLKEKLGAYLRVTNSI